MKGYAVYSQLIRFVFKQQFQYRESIWLKIIGNFLWIYIEISIWKALLGFQTKKGEFQEMLIYICASFAFSLLSYSNVANDLSEKVRSGTIAIDLIRPINLKWYLFWQQLSMNLFRFCFTGLPVLGVVCMLWPCDSTMGIYVPIALVSALMAIVLVFYIQFVIGLLTFWFKEGTYSRMLVNGLMELFSGRKIPLWYYPAFLVTICKLLPFRYTVYEPIAILLGKYEVFYSIKIICWQCIWIAIFWRLEKVMWNRIKIRIEIQGG